MFNDIPIGPVTIHMYGLMIALGFLSAYYLCVYRGRRRGLSEDILWGIPQDRRILKNRRQFHNIVQ